MRRRRIVPDEVSRGAAQAHRHANARAPWRSTRTTTRRGRSRSASTRPRRIFRIAWRRRRRRLRCPARPCPIRGEGRRAQSERDTPTRTESRTCPGSTACVSMQRFCRLAQVFTLSLTPWDTRAVRRTAMLFAALSLLAAAPAARRQDEGLLLRRDERHDPALASRPQGDPQRALPLDGPEHPVYRYDPTSGRQLPVLRRREGQCPRVPTTAVPAFDGVDADRHAADAQGQACRDVHRQRGADVRSDALGTRHQGPGRMAARRSGSRRPPVAGRRRSPSTRRLRDRPSPP